MPSKNSLASFKLHDKKILPNKDEVEKQRQTQESKQGAIGTSSLKKPQNAPFSLRFTQEEMSVIKAKAGRVPVATYLKDLLRDETSLFEGM